MFIDKCLIIHGKEYDYSFVDYKSGKDKIKIKCNTHGVFKQLAINHLISKVKNVHVVQIVIKLQMIYLLKKHY